MKWRSIAFDWNCARAFLVTAEEGSLSAAARELGLTQPTLSRQVSSLEEELGVALFERGGRGLELTPSGLELMDHVRTMGDAAGQLALVASGHSQLLEGNVCITATEVTAAYILPPIIKRLRQEAPGIQIELVASNSSSDLKRREADIAIRGYRPTQPDLIAKKLGDVSAYFYATPNYLKALGTPSSPQDFASAEWVSFDRSDQLRAAINSLGFNVSDKSFPIISKNHLVQWELVCSGNAIGVMPAGVGDAEPRVKRILPDLPPLTADIWLVAHREVRTNIRVKTVFEFLARELMPVGSW